MIRPAFPLLLLIAAAGCTYGERPQDAPAPAPSRCSDARLDALIGKKRSDKVARQAKRLSGATRLRWIAPGMAVTMDYREDRLNLHLGGDGRIESARCG